MLSVGNVLIPIQTLLLQFFFFRIIFLLKNSFFFPLNCHLPISNARRMRFENKMFGEKKLTARIRYLKIR